MYKYLETRGNNNEISAWESKGLSNEKISSTKTSSYDQSPRLVYENARIKLNFLKKDKVTYNHGPIVNIYIVYKLTPGTNNLAVYIRKLSVWCS